VKDVCTGIFVRGQSAKLVAKELRNEGFLSLYLG